MLNNCIKVKIEGKRLNNYIKWLIKQKINIINIKTISYNQIELIIYNKDYNKLKKYSKTYEISIIKKYGSLRMFEVIKNKIYIIIPLIISIILLYTLSNIIFSIEVIYNDKEMVQLVEKELEKYDIKKFKLKKEYSYLEKVKKSILENNKDKLEWLEIIEDGTKYIIKLVERKKEDTNEEYEYQSITVTKDAIITNIKASSGEKLKEVNDYVKKDEIIVNGIITKPNGELLYKKANATILGEVWYKIDIEYPYAYFEEKLTGKSKDVYVINYFNKKIPILTYQKYKTFKVKKNNILLENNILPITLSKEKQYEVEVKEEIYTFEEAVSNAIEHAKNKLIKNNNKILNIKKVEILDKQTIGSKIKLNLFISVEEDITKIIEIKKTESDISEKDLQR